MLHIALEIPLALLAVGGRTEGHHLTAARIKRLGDPFDRAALTGGVTTLKQHDQAIAHVLDPVLHLHQLHLQRGEFLLIELAL